MLPLDREQRFAPPAQHAGVAAVTIRRTRDEDGTPGPGTGFDVEPGSWLAERVAERSGPISSHPTRPIWAIPQPTDDSEVNRSVSVVGAGYGGPAEHYHDRSPEVFIVESGRITMTCDGTDHVVTAGESITVETGVRHTFRNDTDERALVTTEIHSPGRLSEVLPTLGGLAHDSERSTEHPLQQVAIASRLDGNTTFTRQERPGVGVAVDALAPLARAAGYRGAYGKYLQPAFWRDHVEQPPADL